MKKIWASKQYRISQNWLFAPATYFVDSYVPYVEQILLHDTSTVIGNVEFEILKKEIINSKIKKNLLQRLLYYVCRVGLLKRKEICIDLRVNSPGNIAHAIMMHLPIVLLAQKHYQQELKTKNLLLIFPKNTPSYIESLFKLLGYKTILTNHSVQAKAINFNINIWQCLRGDLPELLNEGFSHKNSFLELVTQTAMSQPKKIFISRKDTRKLKNEEVIATALELRGYKKVYAEDYSVIEQISMVSHADSVVAIHGAALGLMVFRALFDLPSIKLIELFPPSHMTNVYRILTQQLGGNWVGVRGKVWPELIEHAYADANVGAIREYSLSDFEVCEKSLLTALEWLDEND